MTETAFATAIRYSVDSDTNHLGLPIYGTEILTNGRGIGQIEVKSDCLCDSYLGDERLWADSLAADGFFKSRD